MQLGTTEVLQDLLPVGRVVIPAQVRLELATQDFQRGTLSNTVGSDETKNLTRTGHGQTVQLETIGRVTVGDLGFQIGGQVDDVNRTKRAFFRTDTTTNAQALRDEGDFGLRGDFDAKLSCANNRT